MLLLYLSKHAEIVLVNFLNLYLIVIFVWFFQIFKFYMRNIMFFQVDPDDLWAADLSQGEHGQGNLDLHKVKATLTNW